PPPVARAACRRVMVVDDNADAADSLAMLLRAMGHTVYTGYSGTAALELAGREQPDAVVLDIGLPDLDGYEVARRLRRAPGLAGGLGVAAPGSGAGGGTRRG